MQFGFSIIPLTNLSILFLYRSIFAPRVNQRFHYLSMGLIVIQILWFIPGIIININFCTPVETIWENLPAIPEKCIFYSTFWLTIISTEILLDCAILALPIREIVSLQLSRQNKCMISFIFLLGGL
jgi:hypothetical protein